jgi:NAD-dependent deacetylase
MKLATPEAFARDPEQVHAFYNTRRQNLLEAEPNEAHRALAPLEAGLAERGGKLFLCTQNIDDLHERAGSRVVHHMHGELLKARCTACEQVTPWGSEREGPLPNLLQHRRHASARDLVRQDAVADGHDLRRSA